MSANFGIEEEYLLVDLDSRQVVADPPPGVIERCRAALGPHFSPEMFKGQIELVSPVFSDLWQAREFFTERRARLVSALAGEGIGVSAAGSHPLGGWRAQRATAGPHFEALFEDHGQVARRSLVCGLHVHVAVAPVHDRIRLMNQLLPWLPLLLVLSTSSPFWEGHASGFMSYRRVMAREWPRMELPERLLDQADYERYLRLLRRTGALRPDNDCWWLIRPSSRFPTIELRIADGCPHLQDALCIAALFRLMVEHCLKHTPGQERVTREVHWITQENLWRAMRDGRRGTFIGPALQEPLSAKSWLIQACEHFAIGPRIGEQALRILDDGTSADRQLACYHKAQQAGLGEGPALRAVVDELLGEMLGLQLPLRAAE